MSDLYDIKRRIKELDPKLSLLLADDGFWHVVRDERALAYGGKINGIHLFYTVVKKPTIFRCQDCFGLPRPPDARDLMHLQKIDTWKRPNVLKRIDERNEAVKRSNERSLSDINYEMGKDMHKVIQGSGSE